MRRVPVSYRHPTPVLSTTGEENLLSRSVSHLKKKKKKIRLFTQNRARS